jgi:hypothetical protein
MRKITFLCILFSLLFQFTYGQDYLASATSTGTGTTSGTTWSPVTSVTINVTGISKVLVTASMNMRSAGTNTNTREANYRIYREFAAADNSGIIKREIYSNSETGVETWGIGTLVHIFDTSSLTGNVKYIIEHSNQTAATNRNVFSSISLTAVALTTNAGNELSNDKKRIGTGVTIPVTYETVPGLITNAITLPIEGDIYVAASINSTAEYAFLNNDRVAEYKLQYSTDNGINWYNLGKPVRRSLYVSSFWVSGFNDSGIVSLVGLLPNQNASSLYKFRVLHKIEGGFIEEFKTENSNLVAVALAHNDGKFPSFYSDVGSPGHSITGVTTPATQVTSSTFIARPAITGTGSNLYVHAQYLVSASNLNESAVPPQRMRASNQLFLDNGTTEDAADEYLRYLDRNGRFGSGGFIGLAENLDSEGNYTVSMKHAVDNISNPDATLNETLTTSEVILTGFQTFDIPLSALSILDNKLTKKLKIYSTPTTVEIRNENPIDAEIKIYNTLGQLISTNYLKNETGASINVHNQKGILIVLIKIDGDVLSKKVILN